MSWKMQLTKPEKAHVAETTKRETLSEIKANLVSQAKTGLVCWECRSIAQKLRLTV